jgi:phage gp29-like protein
MAKTAQKQALPLTSEYNRNTETERIYQLYAREFSTLSSDSIKTYFDAAQKGINFFKAFLFEEIRRRDLRIGGLCQTRKLSVLGSEWKVEAKTENGLVDFIQENFSRIDMSQFITDIVEAQLQGMSIFQLFYEIANGRQYLSDIRLVPNYLVYNKNGIQFLDFSKMTVYDLRSQIYVEHPAFQFIPLDPMYYFETYSLDGNDENGLLNGLIDSAIWGYFFKSYGLKDWSVYLERFAMPSVIGEYDPLMSKPDRDTLTKCVNDFGNLMRATIPNTAKINIQSDMSKANDLYERYMKFWNDELSIRILGQAMTTDTGQGGSFAKAQVGNWVREDIQRGDKALVTVAMNRLIKKIIDINFASVTDYPVFSFVDEENIDYKIKKADLVVKLKQAGFDADENELKEIFGLTLTKSTAGGIGVPAIGGTNSQPAFAEAKPKKKQMIEDFLLDLWSSIQ